tara:strand:+ start:67 stop:513 length:447 start_codon:yes stop_codon:yes gene_type:complete
MTTSIEKQQRINNLAVKFNFIEKRLPTLKSNYKIASVEISKIMNEYKEKKTALIISALDKNSICTDTVALQSINELKKETLDKINPLQIHINLYKDVYTAHQCLLIQYIELYENVHFPCPIYDSFSKMAEIVSENAEENPLNNPYIAM